MLASYNLQSTFAGFSFYHADVTPWIIGGILAVLTGWCLLGGGSRIVKVTSTLVPVMGVAYIVVALIVVIINIRYIPGVFATIFREAFDFQAIFGAFAGSAMMQGIRRGLYSNEAGLVLHQMQLHRQMSRTRSSRDWFRCYRCSLIPYYYVRQPL